MFETTDCKILLTRESRDSLCLKSVAQLSWSSWIDHKIMIIICEEIRRRFTLRNARFTLFLFLLLSGSGDDLRMIKFARAPLFETQQWQSLFAFVSRGKISHGENIAPRRWYRLSRRFSPATRRAKDKSTRARFVYRRVLENANERTPTRRKETLKWNIHPS